MNRDEVFGTSAPGWRFHHAIGRGSPQGFAARRGQGGSSWGVDRRRVASPCRICRHDGCLPAVPAIRSPHGALVGYSGGVRSSRSGSPARRRRRGEAAVKRHPGAGRGGGRRRGCHDARTWRRMGRAFERDGRRPGRGLVRRPARFVSQRPRLRCGCGRGETLLAFVVLRTGNFLSDAKRRRARPRAYGRHRPATH